MRRRSNRVVLALLLLIPLILVTTPSRAERVVVVRPPSGEVLLSEVFYRLQGELRMQGFEAILASAADLPSEREMQRVAQLGQAHATIAFGRVKGEPAAHVWFIDPETAQARVLSLVVAQTEETPTLLALRTVELLRSSLRERNVQTPRLAQPAPPSDRSTQRNTSVPRATPARTRLEPFMPTFGLRVEGAMIWNTLQQPSLFATAFSAGYAFQPHWELAVRFVLPISAQQLTTARAAAKFGASAGVLELRWSMVSPERNLAVQSMVAIGAAHWSASGDATTPLHGHETNAWVWTASAGLATWYLPSSRVGLGATIRLGTFAPKTILRADDQELVLGRPALDLSFGVHYWL